MALVACGGPPPPPPSRTDSAGENLTSAPSTDAPSAPGPLVSRVPVAITGTWSALPPAPLSGRTSFVFAWTDKEVVFWGGRSADGVPAGAEGAAYDPVASAWRVLPPSGLRPRSSARFAWTGDELLVWGGVSAGDFRPLSDGAAYDPSTDRWRPIPPSPLGPTSWQSSYWTGSQWILAGEVPRGGGSRLQAASYDPAGDAWTELPAIDHPIEATLAFSGDDGGLLALVLPLEGSAELRMLTPTGWIGLPPAPFAGVDVGEYPIWSGRELVASDAGTGAARLTQGTPIIFDRERAEWRVGFAPPSATKTASPVWTGRLTIHLAGPTPSLAYDPATDHWSTVDGAGPNFPTVAIAIWAGDRLISWGGSVGEEFEPSVEGAQFVPDDPTIGIPVG
jgi:hypothetical protein